MAILTETRLDELTRQSKLGTKMFSQVLIEAKTMTFTTKDIFLSHSHDSSETDKVDKAAVILRRCGGNVYIDTNDGSLPFYTDAETATTLKKKILARHKFVFLATNMSLKSVWCNWELGYGDKCKYIDQIAIFPLADSENNWKGNEYLKIYPYIDISFLDTFTVKYPDGSSKLLIDWLNS